MSDDGHSARKEKAEVQGRTCPPYIRTKGRYMRPKRKGEKTHVKEFFCFLSRAHTYLIASRSISLPLRPGFMSWSGSPNWQCCLFLQHGIDVYWSDSVIPAPWHSHTAHKSSEFLHLEGQTHCIVRPCPSGHLWDVCLWKFFKVSWFRLTDRITPNSAL